MSTSMGRACCCHCQCQCGRRYQIHVDGFHHTRHRISQAPLKRYIGRICGLRMWLPSAGETLADLRRSLSQTMCSPLLRERACISLRRAALRKPVSQQTLHNCSTRAKPACAFNRQVCHERLKSLQWRPVLIATRPGSPSHGRLLAFPSVSAADPPATSRYFLLPPDVPDAQPKTDESCVRWLRDTKEIWDSEYGMKRAYGSVTLRFPPRLDSKNYRLTPRKFPSPMPNSC